MTTKNAKKIMLWKGIERYRKSIGGESENHHTEALHNYIDDMLDVEEMDAVAIQYAHRMALALECVLSEGAYSNKWYSATMQILGEYRSAMNEIHEQHSPTFMGEPRI